MNRELYIKIYPQSVTRNSTSEDLFLWGITVLAKAGIGTYTLDSSVSGLPQVFICGIKWEVGTFFKLENHADAAPATVVA